MRLLVAKSAGFCFGVKRAMDMAREAAKKHPKRLHTLGPLIHNPQAVDYLENLGVKVKGRIEDVPGGTVIFRSHGVSLQDLTKARKRKLRIIDATCPMVKRAQRFAKFLHRHGYALLIVGDADHPEVEAIRSYVDEKVHVVSSVESVKQLGPWEKLGVIAQTTQSSSLFKEIVASILEQSKEVRVFNTICQATTLRQREAIDIARKVDCMVVVGGYNSGNTRRLASICKEVQPRTYHIERAGDLRPRWLARSGRVGLTAGASTPHWIIEEVEGEIRRLKDSKS
ncbi:MAG: 4-hydroxy-3-methylbut-2-enyl diphosphate reductase [Deltaproteobacteria bacterium RBG_13_53_10]|nr:MAG: 4-hydroxy-3-methylbut-2-enyl diphosphate reductase [Deltaproteobacteria bacterium RBG_13_53_10]